jgi:G2/mitotic-specific cyclin 1/2
MEEDEVVTRRPAAEIELEGMMADGAMYESDLEDYDDDDWLRLSAENEYDCQLELQAIQKAFQDEIDMYDTTMVAEYADDIFEYMGELEVATMPNPRYMDFQTEIEW